MKKKPTKQKNDSGQCSQCLPAKCCNYIAFEIDEPVTRKDFECLLWKIAHEKISLYIDCKRWHIMIHTPCRFLAPDNKCAIYETRPYICKEHSAQNCEYTSDDLGFSEHFKSYDELLAYLKKNHNYRFKQKPTGVVPNC